MNKQSNLRWIVYFSGDRARLNERPLFLTCYLGSCALLQTISHYRYDLDRLVFGKSKSKKSSDAAPTGSLQVVLQQLPSLATGCLKLAVSALFVSFFLYFILFRSFAWTWTLMMMRPFYNLPKANILPASWPSDVFLMIRCICAGTLLSLIWATGNTAFSIFMAKAPLKNGKPLTSESRDPNGSLLNGLKNKKLSVQVCRKHLALLRKHLLTLFQSFAMWELAIIAQDFEDRRKAIFADIDRKEGPVWSQVYAICMFLLKGLEDRVDAYGKQPANAPGPAPMTIEQKQRSSAPLKEDDIYTKKTGTRTPAEKAWDQIARSPGNSPMSEISPIAKKTWNNAKDRVMSKSQQDAVSPENLKAQIEQAAFGLLKVEWLGDLFRRDFGTEFMATTLGTPYAEPTLYSHAALALSHLAVNSLGEDQYGNVHRDVASIVRTLTSIITKVEGLKANFPFHWTDSTGSRSSPEMDQLLDALREGLGLVVAKFEPYSTDLRLSQSDIRLAKEATAKPPSADERPKTPAAEPTKPKQAEKVIKKTAEEKEPRVRRRLEENRREMEQVR